VQKTFCRTAGGGVAALLTHTVMSNPALRRAALRHAPRVLCVAVAPPAVTCPTLAEEMRPYVTSVIREHDIVPHCSLGQVVRLQQEVRAAFVGSCPAGVLLCLTLLATND
jgi:hypothetical protein